jgi:hypothetical protein
MPNDERRTRDEDHPESNAAFHAVPGDLAETEDAAARENRLSGPGSVSAEGEVRRAGEAPPETDEATDGGRRTRPAGDGGERDLPDTWTTKGNPLA